MSYTDQGKFNIKGILKNDKRPKVKYNKKNWEPKGRALALSKALLKKKD